MRLKEHGPRQARRNGQNRRVESLKMPHLNNTPRRFSARNQVVGLGKACCQRLFNEHVDAGFEKLRRGGVMMNCWNGNAGHIDSQIGSQKLLNRIKDGNPVLCGCFLGASRFGLNSRNQSRAFTDRFKFAINAQMVAAERARAGNGNAKLALARYCAASFSGVKANSP